MAAHFLNWLRETKGYVLCLPHEHNDRCYEEMPYTDKGPTLVCATLSTRPHRPMSTRPPWSRSSSSYERLHQLQAIPQVR